MNNLVIPHCHNLITLEWLVRQSFAGPKVGWCLRAECVERLIRWSSADEYFYIHKRNHIMRAQLWRLFGTSDSQLIKQAGMLRLDCWCQGSFVPGRGGESPSTMETAVQIEIRTIWLSSTCRCVPSFVFLSICSSCGVCLFFFLVAFDLRLFIFLIVWRTAGFFIGLAFHN